MSAEPILTTAGLTRDFGTLRAVDEITLSVERGTRHAVIGPNGAGKSTLFALLAGTIRPSAGRITFDATDVTAMPEHRRAGHGLVRTFQHSSLFLGASAVENVMLAVQRREGTHRSPLRFRAHHDQARTAALALLAEIGLAARADDPARALSHGERRQLEVAVALGARPSLLLLDEPGAGMSVAETARFKQMILDLPASITVMLVEHDLDLVFGLADRVTVMHLGKHLITGTPAEVRASDEVQAAYLGGHDTDELFPETA